MRPLAPNQLLRIAFVLGACATGLAAPARAGYIYQVYDDGNAYFGTNRTNSGTSFSVTFSTDHFDVTIVSSISKSKKGVTTLQSNLSTDLLGADDSNPHTLTIDIVYTDYTLPLGSRLHLTTSASATFTDSTTADTATFQGWGDATNSGSFDTGSSPGLLSGTSAGGSSNSITLTPNPASVEFSRNGLFALSQELSTTLTLADPNFPPGAQVEGSSVVTPNPEPTGLALCLTAFSCFGVGAWVRRRMGRRRQSLA
jgi:hypothetical protein